MAGTPTHTTKTDTTTKTTTTTTAQPPTTAVSSNTVTTPSMNSNGSIPTPSNSQELNNTISALHNSIVNSVSIRLPEFFQSCPAIWFIQAETQFRLKNIVVERTKFDYIVAALPPEVGMTVIDVIEKPPTVNPYTELKNKLLARYSLSEEQRLNKILSDHVLGDRKPSEFLRSLQLLAGKNGTINSELLLKLWLRKLPTDVQQILLTMEGKSADELADLADKITEIGDRGQVFAVSNNVVTKHADPSFLAVAPTPAIPTAPVASENSNIIASISQLCSALSEMTTQFQEVKRELHEVRSFNRNSERSSNRFRSRSRGRSSSRSGRRNRPYCYYHYRFGEQAHKCTKPCQFKSNDDSKNS